MHALFNVPSSAIYCFALKFSDLNQNIKIRIQCISNCEIVSLYASVRLLLDQISILNLHWKVIVHTMVFRCDVECLSHVSKLTGSGYVNSVLSHWGKALFAQRVFTRSPAAGHGEIRLTLGWTTYLFTGMGKRKREMLLSKNQSLWFIKYEVYSLVRRFVY